MASRKYTLVVACALAVLGWSFQAQAQSQSFPRPEESAVVKAQGQYAMAQLKSFAAIFGADPSGGFSREAFSKGWAPVNRRYSSPTNGWPARGPSLGESIESLFAQARAAQLACKELEGSCQIEAAAWAKKSAERVKIAKNPGVELARTVDQLS